MIFLQKNLEVTRSSHHLNISVSKERGYQPRAFALLVELKPRITIWSCYRTPHKEYETWI